jgi:hemerythrin-like domain-containing protein
MGAQMDAIEDAIEDLMGEHNAVLLALDLLERVATAVVAASPTRAPMDLEELLKFFREFVDRCHHGKEEDILFPAIEKGNDEQTSALVGVLREEHEEGRRHVRAMSALLERLHGGELTAGELIRRHAQAFGSTLRAHIDREDHILFPKARILLPADEGPRLVQQFEVIERERMGPGVHEAFHALLHRLRASYPG